MENKIDEMPAQNQLETQTNDPVRFVVQQDDDSRRLDRVLRKLFPEIPLSALYRSLRRTKIKVNGKKSSPESRVKCGDEISVNMGTWDLGLGTWDFEVNAANGNKIAADMSDSLSDSRRGKSPPRSQALQVLSATPSAGLRPATPRRGLDAPRPPAGAAAPETPLPSAGDTPTTPPLRVLFENEDVLAVEKPAFLVSCGKGSLSEMVKDYLKGKIPFSLSFKPGPVHRLDRETGGVMLFSKSLRGAQYLSRALREGLLTKTYLAVFEGEFSGEALWEDYLWRDKRLKKTFAAKTPPSGGTTKKAQRAATKVKSISVNKGATLVEVQIKTGRTHQIRAQAALHGHTLLGDTKYGSSGGAFFLHSYSIQFPPDNPLGLPPAITSRL